MESSLIIKVQLVKLDRISFEKKTRDDFRMSLQIKEMYCCFKLPRALLSWISILWSSKDASLSCHMYYVLVLYQNRWQVGVYFNSRLTKLFNMGFWTVTSVDILIFVSGIRMARKDCREGTMWVWNIVTRTNSFYFNILFTARTMEPNFRNYFRNFLKLPRTSFFRLHILETCSFFNVPRLKFKYFLILKRQKPKQCFSF